MTIAKALKAFFLALNGTEPTGDTIADVVRNGAASVERNNESAQAAAVTALTGRVGALETGSATATAVTALAGRVTALETESAKERILLNSATAESTKLFQVTVTDDGTLTATEVVAAG